MTQDAPSTRDKILAAARAVAQARGYGGMSYRDLARDVGIKAASIYHYFPNKGDLGAAVAERYREDAVAALESLTAESSDPIDALRQYPMMFRQALEDGNRMCMCSYMAAEYDDLPDAVKAEVTAFADVNVAWLADSLTRASAVDGDSDSRARVIYTAVAGAQLIARSRADVAVYDALIESYRSAGLIPA